MSTLQSQFSRPAERRTPPQPRPSSPTLVQPLDDAQAFQRLLERACLLSRRQGEALSVLRLQAWLAGDLAAPVQAELLAECACRLGSRVRRTDTVYGWQASHFGVLLHGCEARHAFAVLERLTQCASGSYRLGAQLLHLQLQGGLVRCEAG